MATTRQRPRSASHCKTRIYVTTLPPCLPHTGEETVGPPKGPPPPKGVRKGVITSTFINTTGRQVQTKRNLPTHRPLRYRIFFFILDWCVGSHQGGDDPHRPPPGPPVGKRDLSGKRGCEVLTKRGESFVSTCRPVPYCMVSPTCKYAPISWGGTLTPRVRASGACVYRSDRYGPVTQ